MVKQGHIVLINIVIAASSDPAQFFSILIDNFFRGEKSKKYLRNLEKHNKHYLHLSGDKPHFMIQFLVGP
jgi:hypothetical protein